MSLTDLLLNQYKQSPKLLALIKALIEVGTDDLLISIESLRDRIDIDNASGIQLDLIGSILGQDRPNLMIDSEYRVLLKARIFLNTSGASIPEIEKYSQLVLGESAQVLNGFTSIDLTFFRPLTAVEQTIVTETLTAAAGIKIRFLSYSLGPNPFGFFGNPNNSGFGGLSFPPEGDGFVALL